MDEQLPVPSDLFIDCLWNEERQLGGKLARRQVKKLNREEQIKSVIEAFHQIGGQSRFAQWANDHPHHFFTKIFPKTFPQGNSQLINNGSLTVNYQPAIAPSPLDEPPPMDATFTEPTE
jgi:hypothetical protein